jgi:hypothetical protein
VKQDINKALLEAADKIRRRWLEELAAAMWGAQ